MYPGIKETNKKSKLLKSMTIWLFYILPSRVSQIFISLSMLSLIYYVRNESFNNKVVDDTKLRMLLKCSFDNELMKLPSHTVHWFWSDSFLNDKILIRGVEMTLLEAIQNEEVLFSNYKTIIDELLNNTPKCLYKKLRLDKSKNRLVYKQSLFRLI